MLLRVFLCFPSLQMAFDKSSSHILQGMQVVSAIRLEKLHFLSEHFKEVVNLEVLAKSAKFSHFLIVIHYYKTDPKRVASPTLPRYAFERNIRALGYNLAIYSLQSEQDIEKTSAHNKNRFINYNKFNSNSLNGDMKHLHDNDM